MRTFCRSCLIAILIAGLLDVPAFASNEKPLGFVIQAQAAQISDSKVAIGTTIFPGDTLATEVGGTLRLKVGSSQLYLLSASSATLSQNANLVQAAIGRGTVGFLLNSADQFQLEVPEGIVRSANGEQAYGQVTITGPQEIVISAYRGDLVLDNDGELHTIPAGKSYRVSMDLQPATEAVAAGGTTDDPSVVHTKHRHLLFALVTVAVVAAASYGIWYVLCESSNSPSCP
jgi:hypothetical protein